MRMNQFVGAVHYARRPYYLLIYEKNHFSTETEINEKTFYAQSNAYPLNYTHFLIYSFLPFVLVINVSGFRIVFPHMTLENQGKRDTTQHANYRREGEHETNHNAREIHGTHHIQDDCATKDIRDKFLFG